MTTTLNLKSGLVVESIGVSVPSVPFIGFGRALSVSLHRAIQRATVAGVVRAQESGDRTRLARYLARGR